MVEHFGSRSFFSKSVKKDPFVPKDFFMNEFSFLM